MRYSLVGDVTVPLETPISKVADNGDLWVWPTGYGNGPCLTLTQAEWILLRNSADAAIQAWRNRARHD